MPWKYSTLNLKSGTGKRRGAIHLRYFRMWLPEEGPEMPVLQNGQVQRFGFICKNVVTAVCKNVDPS